MPSTPNMSDARVRPYPMSTSMRVWCTTTPRRSGVRPRGTTISTRPLSDVAVTKETITGDTAVLALSGKDPKGQPAVGSVPTRRPGRGGFPAGVRAREGSAGAAKIPGQVRGPQPPKGGLADEPQRAQQPLLYQLVEFLLGNYLGHTGGNNRPERVVPEFGTGIGLDFTRGEIRCRLIQRCIFFLVEQWNFLIRLYAGEMREAMRAARPSSDR